MSFREELQRQRRAAEAEHWRQTEMQLARYRPEQRAATLASLVESSKQVFPPAPRPRPAAKTAGRRVSPATPTPRVGPQTPAPAASRSGSPAAGVGPHDDSVTISRAEYRAVQRLMRDPTIVAALQARSMSVY